MTRPIEPAFTAAVRREAREGDASLPLGARLDDQARRHGFGTWSALLAADPPETPCSPDRREEREPDIGQWSRSTAFLGDEARLMKRCVDELADDMRAIDPARFASPDFDAVAGMNRYAPGLTGLSGWIARPRLRPKFTDEESEAGYRQGEAIGRVLDGAMRASRSWAHDLMARHAVARAFSDFGYLVAVRGGRPHRVAARLMQHQTCWDLTLDVGCHLRITVGPCHPATEPADLAGAERLIADVAGAQHVDPRALGFIPFAPIRRHRMASSFGYQNWHLDTDMVRGVACRIAPS